MFQYVVTGTLSSMKSILFYSQSFTVLFLWNKYFLKAQLVYYFAFALHRLIEDMLGGIDTYSIDTHTILYMFNSSVGNQRTKSRS